MEYTVCITYTEVYRIHVKAGSSEEAEERALRIYNNGNCDIDYCDTTVNVEDDDA